jgi:hypothetical protein
MIVYIIVTYILCNINEHDCTHHCSMHIIIVSLHIQDSFDTVTWLTLSKALPHTSTQPTQLISKL